MTTSHKTLYYKNSAVFNTIGFIMVVVINTMANFNLINNKNTADISDRYDNLFIPAAYTFAIWGVIYLALMAFIVFQLWLAFSKGHRPALELFMERLRGWWLISCMANSCWLFAWHYELLPLSILLMIALLVCLLAIHLNFNISLPHLPVTKAERLFVHIPFSLYLGWICIATVANIAAFLVYLGWDGMSVPGTIFLIVLCTAASTLLIIRRHNIVVGLVALWALSGIIVKRQSVGGSSEMPIVGACIGAMAIIAISSTWRIITNRRLS
ncbi:hypothetical protein [Chitinophaga ginsengisoli]|uniref:TspO/MBR related protein n=1 Tax=Chitinophaga ginsengisoli TaxID=363837 RepID=A0A2P8FTI1_9BACT|nr:hypothetical protein [Chitinophaga ginsengisoli]PSL24945.1 hypothetical protein CLV42_11494 [Chitinophaga ginsengisoli]